MKYIELFSGCGGMSLGLEKSGFELYFANELSPMASETYAYNILEENLEYLAEKNINPSKVKWITSKFPVANLKERLRENPFEAAKGEYSDINSIDDIEGKLLVGDIDNLLDFFEKNPDIIAHIQNQNIDLVSGGPPCQSFSLAGKREKNNKKNQLPLSFAKIVGLIKPKAILLENVKGITSPFTEDGEKYYAWLEAAKAFALEGYVPICMMVNSKYFGVGQSRPRYIMQAFRKDIFENLIIKNKNNQVLQVSNNFYKLVHNTDISTIGINAFKYYDIESEPELFNGRFFPLLKNNKTFVTSKEVIEEIRRTDVVYKIVDFKKGYSHFLNSTFKNKNNTDKILLNHEPRNHHFGTKARFRFYQVINEFQNGLRGSAVKLFSGEKIDDDKKQRLADVFMNYDLYFNTDEGEVYKKPRTLNEVKELLETIPTKKHSQRALLENEPAPAQLTIPDDLCHYHMENLRTLTVREMARFQSFPDWFVFRSKVTTGGDNRKFEVPQYTQVGNAVPPLLALELGKVIYKLLKEY